MRVFKFRGKRISGGQWLYGNSLIQWNSGIAITNNIAERKLTDKNTIEVAPNTVGQFTSLYDKNGREIYEGDILDFNGLNIEVRFVRGVFALLCNGDLDDELCGDCRTDLFAKVIGNIHDNPELLNQ